MKFTKSQIAALVLGYLRSEKLLSTAAEFVETCEYFEENDIKVGRYFATRVSGMTLVDYLHEYAVMYSIVQARLEETSFYETHSKPTLVEQLLYLLDRNVSEVEATSAASLPGNENTSTPNKKRRKCKDKEDIDVTDVLTQSLLENHELHEKIAETINIVRSTPETKEDSVGASASIELDAVIKTVVQKTEEDPLYNKMIDEIIGKPQSKDLADQNNDAVQSIVEASKNAEPKSDVLVFDGSLDTYLKSSGATSINNQVYFNPGGLIVMPPAPAEPNLLIVNNQLLKLTESEFMSLPTVIVNDKPQKKLKHIIPKPAEAAPSDGRASHVRNLDFSTPTAKEWDTDLRMLAAGKDKSVKKKRNKSKEKQELEEADEKLKRALQTPVKDNIPKTPGMNSTFHTPFNDVIDEQLKGVDLNSIPTPCIPITPGFDLTYNQRPTDYSTSSSYYQPSDTEQNKSIEQLIEECKKPEANLKILSDVVIGKANEHFKVFNNNIIGKKNLSLIKDQISSSSDSESDQEENKTVIKADVSSIKSIIKDVPVKKRASDESKKKELKSHLEEKRLKAVNKLKQNVKKPKVTKRKKPVKKKEAQIDDEEADKLVKGLAQRGIHLIPNKTPQKQNKVEENEAAFDLKVYSSCEVALHEEKARRKPLKTYDLSVCSKSISARVFLEDLNEETTRVIKWTGVESLMDLKKEQENDELMDLIFMKNRGTKKRKCKFEEKPNDKKNKIDENDISLLKKIDVDVFLDKVHGE